MAGKWERNKNNPLNLIWMRSPMRILGVHVSYNERENNELNFNLKMRKMQTNLDICMENKKSHIVWKSYDNQVSRTVTTSLFSLHVERSRGYYINFKNKTI